jgi:DNA-binding transcriptional MerR regulator
MASPLKGRMHKQSRVRSSSSPPNARPWTQVQSQVILSLVKIGEVARLAGVGIDTVRFYERRGLLPAPPRSSSGYRDYSSRTVSRLRLTKQLQQLGFTLNEVVEVLSDVDGGEATCAGERERFEAVLVRIDEKLAALRSMRSRLTKTLRRCESGQCDVLEASEIARA